VAPVERVAGHGARPGIGLKGPRRAPEQVARKLVQQDNERQRATGSIQPVVQLPGGGSLVVCTEAGRDLGVELVVPLELVLAPPPNAVF
jgi:hypothetical protein